MTQERFLDDDPITVYWSNHGGKEVNFWNSQVPPEVNPWANGDYAFLAIVCGFIFMLTVSVGVGI